MDTAAEQEDATVAEIKIEDIQKSVRDTFYVAVGLGVIAFQKAQVQRNDLQKQLEANITEAQRNAAETVKTVEERLGAVEERLDEVLDDVEARLPEQARTVLSQARTAAKESRAQLRTLIRTS